MNPQQPSPNDPRPELDDIPPVLGSWRNIYILVLATLALLIAAMWAFSRMHS
jgi:hypothetical protein